VSNNFKGVYDIAKNKHGIFFLVGEKGKNNCFELSIVESKTNNKLDPEIHEYLIDENSRILRFSKNAGTYIELLYKYPEKGDQVIKREDIYYITNIDGKEIVLYKCGNMYITTVTKTHQPFFIADKEIISIKRGLKDNIYIAYIAEVDNGEGGKSDKMFLKRFEYEENTNVKYAHKRLKEELNDYCIGPVDEIIDIAVDEINGKEYVVFTIGKFETGESKKYIQAVDNSFPIISACTEIRFKRIENDKKLYMFIKQSDNTCSLEILNYDSKNDETTLKRVFMIKDETKDIVDIIKHNGKYLAVVVVKDDNIVNYPRYDIHEIEVKAGKGVLGRIIHEKVYWYRLTEKRGQSIKAIITGVIKRNKELVKAAKLENRLKILEKIAVFAKDILKGKKEEDAKQEIEISINLTEKLLRAV
ncbi:hypothetical protein ACFL4O_00390, partial [bacterium]